MGKVIKIILSTISALILALLFLPIIASILLNIKYIQNYTAGKATVWLSEKMGTQVSIESVHLKLFNRLSADGVYLETMEGDTLFYADQIVAPLKGFDLNDRELHLGNVMLDNARFYLHQDTTLGISSLKQITNYIRDHRKNPPKDSKRPFKLTADGCTVISMDFVHTNFNKERKSNGVDFGNLDIRDIDLNATNIRVKDDSIFLTIESIKLHELNGGLVIEDMSAKEVCVSPQGIGLRDALIRTPDSSLELNYLSLISDSWASYKNAVQDVRFEVEIVNSTISTNSVARFAVGLRDWNLTLRNVSINAEGTVEAMKGRIANLDLLNSAIAADFVVGGLPNIRKTHFDIDLHRLLTSAEDARQVMKIFSAKGLGESSKWFQKLGEISAQGQFKGEIDNFHTQGWVSTSLGVVNMNLDFVPRRGNQTTLVGNVETSGFMLGKLLSSRKLGAVTLKADIKGVLGEQPKFSTTASLPSLSYNNYTYSNIAIDGSFEKNEFTGVVNSKDPNMEFDFDGNISFNDSIPRYNFRLDIANCDLHKLNFNRRDTVSVIRGLLIAEGSGAKIDEINALASIEHMSYFNGVDTIQSGRIDFRAENSQKSKLLEMRSSFADIDLRGTLSYENIFSYMRNSLITYLPSFYQTKRDARIVEPNAASLDNYYLLSANIKEANNVAGIFVPQLELAKGTKLYFMFNPSSDLFTLSLDSEYIQMGEKLFVSNLSMNSQNRGDSISVYIRAEDVFVGEFYTPNFSVMGGVKNNVISLATRFSNPERGVSAMISTTSTLRRDQDGVAGLEINLNPSYLNSDGRIWTVGADRVVVDTSRIVVDNFVVRNGIQSLSVDGVASRLKKDTLKIGLNSFDLTPLSQITSRKSYNLSGTSDGYANIVSALKDGFLYSNINFTDIKINNTEFPNTIFESSWDFLKERAGFDLSEQGTNKNILLGYYIPEEKFFWARYNADTVDISLLDPLVSGVLRGSSGSASVQDLTLTSRAGRYRVGGKMRITDFMTTVDYTNVTYQIETAEVVVDSLTNVMTILPATLRDQNGGTGDLSFKLDFSNIRNIGYDLTVVPRNLKALGTTATENPLFYGDVSISGQYVKIKGDKSAVNIEANVETAGQSSFYLPISENNSMANSDFIHFITPQQARADSMSLVERRRELLRRRTELREGGESKLQLSLLLSVLPNTEAHIIIDPTTGNIIRGRGNGSLTINVNPSNKDFNIYGDYVITEGVYHLSLYNFLNYDFLIDPGSSLQWSGDPADAMLDLTAVHKLKASLQPLMGSDQRYSRSTPVDCIIRLSDNLSNPTLTPDIRLPNATPEIQSLVAYTITPETVETQFLSLLGSRSFMPSHMASNQNMQVESLGFDILFNQLGSALLTSDRFNFSPKHNVRKEGVTSSEWGGSFYGELIKDRLILDVDFMYDTGDTPTRTANSLMGDATLSYRLDESGNFKVNAFTRTIDRFDEYQGLQESGLGIFYREDFDNFKELRQIVRSRFMGGKSRKMRKNTTSTEK